MKIILIVAAVMMFGVTAMVGEHNPFLHNDGKGQCYNFKVSAYGMLSAETKGVLIRHQQLLRTPYVHEGFVIFELSGQFGKKKISAKDVFMQSVPCQQHHSPAAGLYPPCYRRWGLFWRRDEKTFCYILLTRNIHGRNNSKRNWLMGY